MLAKWWGVLAISLVVGGISGCAPTPVPDDAWLVSPISYDNAFDGAQENRTDVTYSMPNMTGDTAGGFWTESGGSWLHIDHKGDALRFNELSLVEVRGLSAITPTLLAVTREGGGQPAGLYVFDTDERTWMPKVTSGSATGDVVALSDGRMVFVDYPQGAPPRWPGMPGQPGENLMPYSIMSVDRDGQQITLIGPEAGLAAAAVALDSTPDGALYASTESESFMISADGTRSQVTPHQLARPVLAVGPSGALLSVAPSESGSPEAEWVINSGSSEARDVLAVKGHCQPGISPPLSVAMDGRVATLPFSCSAGGATWGSETSFVVSIGDEGGTVLAKVSLPEDWTD